MYGPLTINLWWEYFTIYKLHEILWQKDDKQFAEILNWFQIGKHTKDDLKLQESRAVTMEESEQLNHIPNFFPTTKKVWLHNGMIQDSTSDYKITVTAIDITPNDISAKFRQQLRAAICRQKKENTGGLPRQVIIAVNQQYDLTSNIAVEHGLIMVQNFV